MCIARCITRARGPLAKAGAIRRKQAMQFTSSFGSPFVAPLWTSNLRISAETGPLTKVLCRKEMCLFLLVQFKPEKLLIALTQTAVRFSSLVTAMFRGGSRSCRPSLKAVVVRWGWG